MVVMSSLLLLANDHPTSFSQESVEGLGAPLTNLSPHFAASDTPSFIFLDVLEEDKKQVLFVTKGALKTEPPEKHCQRHNGPEG